MNRILVLLACFSFLVGLSGSVIALEVLECPTGMVSYWTVDNWTASDLVGNKDGTIYGATQVAGKVNDALSFDGANGLYQSWRR